MTARVLGLFQRNNRLLKGCSISTLKLAIDGEIKHAKPPNFDYYAKGNNIFRLFFDNTKTYDRFHDNSKVIVVEGNIASGKSNVAAKLAELLDMAYFPDPTEDDIYINRNVEPNFDLRTHNPLLPYDAKYYTCEMFWNESDFINKGKGLYLQYHFYLRRYWNYLRALCHLFNTGQGVIIDRSPFSEFAFADAMHKCNYLSQRGLLWFKQNHSMTITNIWKPHLLIYIKAPIEKIRERIKKRNIPWEVNARNLTDEFLNAYDDVLGKYYFENMDQYSYTFAVDGSSVDVYNDDDIRVIAQRICEIDFSGDHLLRGDYKLLKWRKALRYEISTTSSRVEFSNAYHKFKNVFNQVIYPMDLPELIYTYEAQELQGTAIHMDPRTCFSLELNPRYKSILEIMFNPWIEKRNFCADLPKYFLWT
ncbi:NADH dehydrogenase [ubiquinone] 1 alpha subcomplex subunit 10, mitochondrial [Schistosoma japonicum]|uniref:NADH:ubiquinone reductase 42kD subunit precurs n=1 Tax=Schistosoma japonicum TaxID=6182 RepID=C1LFG5_SCHJA|nr:NADH dehydrogenase [ubiquinone] 1 alpha subcomplex subunit 10, mitochondrial [Schistosoma japonicum]CAX73443.1 NADH:ubiquinone reductase 42kD subunit precurs [Schistosoma japonicum]